MQAEMKEFLYVVQHAHRIYKKAAVGQPFDDISQINHKKSRKQQNSIPLLRKYVLRWLQM
jgi:hypothetical protein